MQNVDISPATARTDLILGAELISWIQEIDSAPKMRSVRAVEGEISTFCTRESAQGRTAQTGEFARVQARSGTRVHTRAVPAHAQ